MFLDDFGNNVAPVASITEKQQFVKIPTCTSAKSELRDIKGDKMSNKIYVGNLSFRLEERDLQSAFEQFGTVSSCKIITDRETGRSKGFAFVEMSTADEAREAISSLDGSDLEGRPLRVNEAKPQEKRERNRW